VRRPYPAPLTTMRAAHTPLPSLDAQPKVTDVTTAKNNPAAGGLDLHSRPRPTL
jgi:hypothetical protein